MFKSCQPQSHEPQMNECLRTCFGDKSSVSRGTRGSRPVKFYSTLDGFIFGFLDPINVFFDSKINDLRADVSCVLSKLATLLQTIRSWYTIRSERAVAFAQIIPSISSDVCSDSIHQL